MILHGSQKDNRRSREDEKKGVDSSHICGSLQPAAITAVMEIKSGSSIFEQVLVGNEKQ
jgi:hypothetical protein